MPQTLAEKVWERHVVHRADGEPDLLYVDLHLVHEVTSPQAFDGLRLHGRARAPARTSRSRRWTTTSPRPTVRSPTRSSARQMDALRTNADEFGITLFPWGRRRPGHRPRDRPRDGLHAAGHDDRLRRLPHVDPRRVRRARVRHRNLRGRARARHPDAAADEAAKTMAVTVDGDLPPNCCAKDIILAIINRIGTGGGVGHVVEYRGAAIRALSMEGRMTICNMSIEAGARAGHGRARRHDVRLRRGTAARAEGRGLGVGARGLAHAADRRRRHVRRRGHDRRVDAAPVRRVGDEPRAVGRRSTAPCPTPTTSTTRRRGKPPSARCRTWRSRPARRSATSGPTRSSSARARTPGSRTCASPPTSWPGRKVADGLRALVVPGQRRGEGAGRARGPGPRLLRRGLRVARRRLLDVPGHEPRHPRPRRPQRRAPATATSRAGRARAGARTW